MDVSNIHYTSFIRAITHSFQFWAISKDRLDKYLPVLWFPLWHSSCGRHLQGGGDSQSALAFSLPVPVVMRLRDWSLELVMPVGTVGGTGAFMWLHPSSRTSRAFEELHLLQFSIALLA